jgi:hypothetical protein
MKCISELRTWQEAERNIINDDGSTQQEDRAFLNELKRYEARSDGTGRGNGQICIAGDFNILLSMTARTRQKTSKNEKE